MKRMKVINMTVFEMAKNYYPRLWDKSRLEQLVEAGRMTEENMNEIISKHDDD